MVKNVVAGCVVVALIFLVLLAYAQEHHECWQGRLVKDPRPLWIGQLFNVAFV
jgi:hypothetical protein